MRRIRTGAAAATLLLLAAEPVSAASEYARHWTELGDAPPLFWAIAIVATLLYLGFTYYVDRSPSITRRKKTKRGYALLGVAMLLIVFSTFLLYASAGLGPSSNVEVTDDTWNWRPGETLRDPGGSDLEGEPYAGYHVAISQGCLQGGCHTLFVRPQDTAPGHASLYYPEISEATDYEKMPMPLWGTQRNGPDLAFAGRLKPSMQFQKQHLVDPRSTAPNSIMPSYGHLTDQQLNDLSAFIVTLGNPPAELKSRTAENAARTPTGLSPAARRGRQLVSEHGCTGCHTTDGTPSTGPTLQGLYGSTETLSDGSTAEVDEEYLRTAIVDPDAQIVHGYPAGVMPGDYGEQLSDDEVDAILEYLRSLE